MSLNTFDQNNSDTDSEVRIVLLGKTGSGKSATGNTILDRKMFKAEYSSASVTKNCEKHESTVEGRRIVVIDTPGLFDTSLTKEKLKVEIESCVYKSVPGPHVFLIVINLRVRFTEEERQAVEWIQKNFGEDALLYTIILFSNADCLEGKALKTYISESKFLLKLTDSCGGRYLGFNNEDLTNRTQVTDLLKMIDKLVKMNGGSFYTNEMYKKVQLRIKLKKAAIFAALGIGAVVGGAGGVVLAATEAVVLPVGAMVAGTVFTVGSGLKMFYDKTKKKDN